MRHRASNSDLVPALLEFHTKLKALHEVGGQLAKATTFSDFCCMAVELGRQKLGFDRLGLWFFDQDPGYMVGTFGTDEHGHTRDERGQRIPVTFDNMRDVLDGRVLIPETLPAHLFNEHMQTIGYGWKASAKLWDGEQAIGWISTDNLLSQRTVTEYDLELLAIYADTLGHLAVAQRAKEALNTERNLLRTIIDTVPDILFVKNSENRYVLVNQAFWQRGMLQVSGEEDIIGKTAFDILPHDLAAIYSVHDLQVIQSGVAVMNVEEPGIGVDGVRAFITNKTPLHDAEGHVTGLVGVARDITELKETEARNRELAIAQGRVQTLRDLIGNLSHDLRNPLAIINSNLYLLERLSDPERQRTYLASIKEQTTRLGNLIEDILTISRLEGLSSHAWKPVDLKALIHNVEKRLHATAAAKQLHMTLEILDEPPQVEGNEIELDRMLFNLVQNAIAYTPAGGTVSIKTFSQDNQPVIEVEDTGIGIDEADLAHIFDHFFRADRARSLHTGGTGLGLPIVRRIVDMHHGRIEVESTPGEGSRFRVFLPVSTGSLTA